MKAFCHSFVGLYDAIVFLVSLIPDVLNKKILLVFLEFWTDHYKASKIMMIMIIAI